MTKSGKFFIDKAKLHLGTVRHQNSAFDKLQKIARNLLKSRCMLKLCCTQTSALGQKDLIQGHFDRSDQTAKDAAYLTFTIYMHRRQLDYTISVFKYAGAIEIDNCVSVFLKGHYRVYLTLMLNLCHSLEQIIYHSKDDYIATIVQVWASYKRRHNVSHYYDFANRQSKN